MKQYYEVNIAHRGKVETHTFQTKKEKNLWLVKYLTCGDGAVWGRKQYDLYLKNNYSENKRPIRFEKYIFSLIKDAEQLTIYSRHEIILIRKKNFSKTS